MKTITLLISLLVAAPALLLAAEPKHPIRNREERQQNRIADGVKSGELTPKETARLEKREAELRKQIKDERAANGGKLTPKERAEVEKELNGISRQIHRQKHDDQKAPPAK
ncbi:MAG: hypothetical protein HYX71_11455 [Opitutae bacterium]|nr:hypothetical protein [Opitutae bacterium]